MPTRTDHHQVFDQNGKLIREEIVKVEIPPDPAAELYAAIQAADTLDELKAALLGAVRPGRVAARPVSSTRAADAGPP